MRKDVRPTDYLIRLDVDLAACGFSGSVKIDIIAENGVREIVLDMADLVVRRAFLMPGGRGEELSFRAEPEDQALRLFLPREIKGAAAIGIEFEGRLNDKMAGFYLSRYRSRGSEGVLAVTQFEETEARKAFPCFDHPSMKAVFRIELTVDEHMVAVSNTPVEEEASLPGGKKLVRFSPTPPMATYLLFFGVGPFEIREDPGRVSVRALSVPGRIDRSALALDFGRKSLDYFEKYTELPFPIPKLDLIAVPDFAFGAMENWGAMTFRENLLLRDPEATSRAGEERICEVIAHETAHQWFGNLVTPEDWNDLWLNESFATFFGYRVVDHYRPDWETWDRFVNGHMRAALERDALIKTHPVEMPPGEQLVINAGTAPIIYSKGGAVLRHLHRYMGERRFQQAVKGYLSEFAYGCATSRSAWDAIDRASELPVRRVVETWLNQPGYPLLEVRLEQGRVELRQERFTYLDQPSESLWRIPIEMAVFLEDGGYVVKESLLEKRSGTLDVGGAAAACLANLGRSGLYRVNYTGDGGLEGLGEMLFSSGRLAPVDRWGLQDDLYALVMAGREPLSRYLDFLSRYRWENAYLPVSGIGDRLLHASLVYPGALAEKVAEQARGLLEGVLKRTGVEPSEGESLASSRLRDDLLWKAALFGCEQAVDFGLEKFFSLCRGDSVSQEVMGAALRIGALSGGRRAFDRILERLEVSDSEFERLELLGAVGCFSEQDLVEKALEYVLDKVPVRNKHVPVSRMSENPYALPLLWDWYVSNHKRISEFHPLHHERIITYVVPLGGLGREEAVESFFGTQARVPFRSEEVVEIALERLEVHRLMRNRGSVSGGYV